MLKHQFSDTNSSKQILSDKAKFVEQKLKQATEDLASERHQREAQDKEKSALLTRVSELEAKNYELNQAIAQTSEQIAVQNNELVSRCPHVNNLVPTCYLV